MAIYDPAAGGMWVETTQNTYAPSLLPPSLPAYLSSLLPPSTTFTWSSIAAAGKQVNVQIYDADGIPASVNDVPAVAGDDASCVACPTFMGEQAC